MRFTSSNPCDFIIWSKLYVGNVEGLLYKLELKSLLGKSLPYSNIKPKTKKLTAKENSIKFTRVLLESERKGISAGFIVNFRDINETFKVMSSRVLHFLENSDRKSIPIEWFRQNGTVIQQTIKISRWRYDLEWL